MNPANLKDPNPDFSFSETDRDGNSRLPPTHTHNDSAASTSTESRAPSAFTSTQISAARSAVALPRNTFLGDLIGRGVSLVGRTLSPTLIARSLTMAREVGHYAVLGGSALTLIYAIVGAIRFNSFALFATGIGLIVALAVAQFTAARFLTAAEQIISSTPSRIASPAFLECSGLLLLLAAVGVLLSGISLAIQLSSFSAFLPFVLFTAALGYSGALALHPELVNVANATGSAGDEAVGLMSYFAKAGLKLVPVFFCLFAAAGCLALVAGFFDSGSGIVATIGSILESAPMTQTAANMPGLTGSVVVLFACLLPLGSYLLFLVSYLTVDTIRAVLSVPAKLDALKH